MTGKQWPSDATNGTMRDNAPASHLLAPRMGFVIDVVGYGQRNSPAQEAVQIRLVAMLEYVLDTINAEFDSTDRDAGSGDAVAVFLPAHTDPTRALPDLLKATSSKLTHDNGRYRDRMRLRMSLGFGLMGHGPLGFTGPLITELSRLNDSTPVRDALCHNPNLDLAVVVSNALHDLISTAYLPPDLTTMRRIEVAIKEFSASAWLWQANDDRVFVPRPATTRTGA